MRIFRASARPGLLAALFIAFVPACVMLIRSTLHATDNTITVNNTTDPASTSGNGFCTLREAIRNANAESDTTSGDCAAGTGNDTIVFSVSGTIPLRGTLPAILNNLTIDGSGQTITVDGGGLYGVMAVSSSGTLDLANLTIADGNATYGGGIYNQDGTLTVTNVTFQTNSAQWGGAISNGIFGSLTVTGCTFSGNQAQYAGAIYNAGASAPQTIINSTFSGNSAQYSGGAIFSDVFSVLTITNVTFSANTATNSGGNVFSYTGPPHGGPLTVANSILAGASPGGNCHGTVTDGGYNISDDGTCKFSGTSLNNTDPLLDPAGLQDNGGPTETIALQSTSPAIDIIPVADCPATDQRGAPRPDPEDGPGGPCDIGAFESGGVVPISTPTATPTATPTPSGQITLSRASVDFGQVKLDATARKTITIKNSGKGVLNITVENDLAAPFGEKGAGSFILHKHKSHDVVVTFKPSATGTAPPQTLVIDSSDPNHTHLEIPVNGAGK